MINLNVFGPKIRMLRDKSGLNQAQLANFLDVDQSFISKCEKGERQLNVDALDKVCCLFGCTISELSDTQNSSQRMQLAFRAKSISRDDLIAISDINKIALNIRQMKELLGVK